MSKIASTHHAYWLENHRTDLPAVNCQQYDSLVGSDVADVLIIGGGITGLSTALELLHRGKSVTVCEALTIGAGTTGGSSGHLDAHPEQGPKRLISTLGEAAAREYTYARKQAIAAIEHRAAGHCDFIRVPGYSYSESASDTESMRHEFAAAIEIGLDAHWCSTPPLRFASCGYEVRGMARIDSYAYVRHLAEMVVAAGGRIFEKTLVSAPMENDAKELQAGEGSVRFEHVVSAVHCNFSDSMKLYLQTPPYQSYVLAVRVAERITDGLYWDNADPYHYIRRAVSGDDHLLLVGGCDHHTGSGDPVGALNELERYARERFDVIEIVHRWSAELFEPTDGLPLIGQVPGKSNVWIATGLSGIGLTLGTVAGWLLADQIVDRPCVLAKEFSPERFSLSEMGSVAMDHLPAATSYAERVLPGSNINPRDIAPGEGAVGNVDGHFTGICRDSEGREHRHRPVCTHMGGTLHWNAAEQTWDCPVHGGRFQACGLRLYGPPESPLEPSASAQTELS